MIRPSQRHFAPENLDPRQRAGLVGHWIGGGSGRTWIDMSGYGHHGVFVGNPVWTLGQGGRRAALEFDGVSAIANAGTIPQLDNTPQATMAFWGYRASSAETVSANIQTGSTNWFEISSRSDGNVYFVAANGGVNYCYQGAVPLGWHHYAFVFDGTLAGNDRVKPYIDGVPIAAVYAGPFPSTLGSGGTMRLGAVQTVAAGKGVLDDARVYNRALSAAEIALLAQPAFLPVVPRRWFLGPIPSTDATAASATWVAPAATAILRFTSAATAASSTWTAPAATARTRYTVPATAALSTWVAPSASAQLNRRRSIPISGSRASYSIAGSRASYHIEGS